MMSRNAGDTTRETEAARRAGLLAPQLPKLAIVLPPVARVPGIEVRWDGEVVGDGQWGSDMPLDAEQHTIEVRAPSGGARPPETT